MSTILIKSGTYRNQPVAGMVFELVKGFQTGAKGGYVTVKSAGYFGPDMPEVVRVNVDSIEDVEFVSSEPTEVIHPNCLLYTSPSPRDRTRSRMPSSA